MNEELQEKFDIIKEKIVNLVDEKAKITEEIESLNNKGLAILTKKELERYQELHKMNSSITTVLNNAKEKALLLDMYISANNKVKSLKNSKLKGAAKVSALTNLTKILYDIKKSDTNAEFTEEDIKTLQTEVNNKVIFEETLDLFEDLTNNSIEDIINEINSILESLNKIKKGTEKNTKKDNNDSFIEKERKKIIKTIVGLSALAAIIIGVKSCDKDLKSIKTSVNNLDDTKSYEDTSEYSENAVVVLGAEDTVTYIPSENVVVEPTTAPDVISVVEPTNVPEVISVVEPTLVPEVVETVEPIATPLPVATPAQTFNPATDKVTDMNNRANVIAGTGFFEDLYNSEIVDVLEAVDNKDLISPENIEYANLFRNKFNSIVEHYFWDTITEEDVKSVEALRYLAKDNSDLDRFLETFTNLLQDILRNPSSQEAKDKMNSFLKIFAGHLAGFNHPNDTDSALTEDATFNENAEVKDFYDWEMLKELIIDPTYIMFYPRDILLETDGVEVENIMNGVLNQTIDINTLSESMQRYVHAVETFMEMESALVNHPQYCEIVGYNYDENTALVRGN